MKPKRSRKRVREWVGVNKLEPSKRLRVVYPGAQSSKPTLACDKRDLNKNYYRDGKCAVQMVFVDGKAVIQTCRNPHSKPEREVVTSPAKAQQKATKALKSCSIKE